VRKVIINMKKESAADLESLRELLESTSRMTTRIQQKAKTKDVQKKLDKMNFQSSGIPDPEERNKKDTN